MEVYMATYPVIPLRGLVVFPHTSITIDMGRKKSIAAYNNAVLHDNLVLFCAQKDLLLGEVYIFHQQHATFSESHSGIDHEHYHHIIAVLRKI